jgi:hypothetical protein
MDFIKIAEKKIKPQCWYSVNELAKKKVIFGIGFMGIKHLVETGRLPAAQFKATRDAQVRYRIWGAHILDYIKSNQPKIK